MRVVEPVEPLPSQRSLCVVLLLLPGVHGVEERANLLGMHSTAGDFPKPALFLHPSTFLYTFCFSIYISSFAGKARLGQVACLIVRRGDDAWAAPWLKLRCFAQEMRNAQEISRIPISEVNRNYRLFSHNWNPKEVQP